MLTRLAILLFFSLLQVIAAANCFDSRVTLSCTDCTIEEALENIESQVACSFSYNPNQIKSTKQISVKIENLLLREAIAKIAGEGVKLKQRGRYILFTSSENAQPVDKQKREYVVEGIVKNSVTGEVLSQTAIYVVGEKTSALTNKNGYYKIEMESKSPEFGLSYSKNQFFDTLIIIQPSSSFQKLDIQLSPRPPAPKKLPIKNINTQQERPVEELTMVQFMVPEVQRTLSLNYAFLEDIPVQLSLLPSVGTNRLTGGQKTSTVSINLISGYNAAVEGAEVGGVLNIVRKDVSGIQAAGFGNIVGGKVKGVQAAGFFNNTLGSVHGAQAAGFANILVDTITGLQAAGFANVLKGAVYGGQLAGFANVATKNSSGVQAAGFANVTKDTLNVVQLAGFGNSAGLVRGLQGAGFYNQATKGVTGAQTAGFMNVSKSVTGLQAAGFGNFAGDASFQVAGFMNVAKKVNGVQLALFNFNDSSNVSIGLLSFSKKGMWSLEFSADEIQPYNLSFRTGNRRFYNILQAGYSSYTGLKLWSFGYGIGTQLGKPTKRLNYNIELFARNMLHEGKANDNLALNARLDPTLNIRLGEKRPSIIIGPTLNVFAANRPLNSPESNDPPNPPSSYPSVYDPVDNLVEVDFWVGGKLGLRI